MGASKPLVMMMAGGTGGHVYPAIAVATELLSRGYRVEWVGTARGLEHRVVPAAGIQLHCLAVRGVRGKNLPYKLLSLAGLALASLQALWLVFRRSPRCVVGMGEYVAGPAGVAAWLLRRPLVIHEQNAVAGTANRLLAPLSRRVLSGFSGAFDDSIESTVVGNPVRREVLAVRDQGSYDFEGQRSLHLLVVGGSLGARPINQVVPEVLRRLIAEGVRISVCHQTGESGEADVRSAYGSLCGAEARVVPFIDDMAAAYEWSDLVLCRSGALTVAELAIVGRPSILVPLPHAIDDHQTANARSLTDCGAALLLRQQDMDEDSVMDSLRALLADPVRLRRMATAAYGAATPDAARRVSDICEELIYA